MRNNKNMKNFNIENLLKEVPITEIASIKDNKVYSLLEKFNMCGSVKIKTVYWIFKKAIEKWKLNKSKIILEASSWNTAISLSYLAWAFWFKVLLIIPKTTASCKKKLIKSYWAKLIEVEGITDDAIDYKNKLYKKNPNKYFLTDQFNNEDNLNAHYYLTWAYIYEKLWNLDFFVWWMWTTWTLLWVAKYLKERNPNIKIIWINPLDKIEWIKDYSKVRNIWKFYKKYKYLIDKIINVTFKEDAIVWINDYLNEWYFNWISSWAILSGTKKFLKWKKWLKWLIVAPDGWDYYFSEIFNFINKNKISKCK